MQYIKQLLLKHHNAEVSQHKVGVLNGGSWIPVVLSTSCELIGTAHLQSITLKKPKKPSLCKKKISVLMQSLLQQSPKQVEQC